MGESRQAAASLAELSRSDLERMAAAGAEIQECYRVLAKTDSNIVAEVVKDFSTFFEWDHYPPGDAVDWETHSQFYFHTHPKEDRSGEHGHFHTFMRYDGIAADAEPTPLDVPQAENEDRIGSHLVAISMDKRGFPIKLFTVNRWVTDETWYPAPAVVAMLDQFDIDHTHPSWAANRWLGAMFRLFRPQMVRLLDLRDAKVASYKARHKPEDVFEDRGLEITSELSISVPRQIKAVENALKRLD